MSVKKREWNNEIESEREKKESKCKVRKIDKAMKIERERYRKKENQWKEGQRNGERERGSRELKNPERKKERKRERKEKKGKCYTNLIFFDSTLRIVPLLFVQYGIQLLLIQFFKQSQ